MSIPYNFDPMGTLEALPNGYRRVKYLASTVGGKQYIDTLIQPADVAVWELTVQAIAPVNGYSANGAYGLNVGRFTIDVGRDGTNPKNIYLVSFGNSFSYFDKIVQSDLQLTKIILDAA